MSNKPAQPFIHEAQLINYQFLSLVRTTLQNCPEMIKKITGIDEETARLISDLTPNEFETITKSPVLYFMPRLDKKMLQDLALAAKHGNPLEIACALQHSAVLAN